MMINQDASKPPCLPRLDDGRNLPLQAGTLLAAPVESPAKLSLLGLAAALKNQIREDRMRRSKRL